MINFKTLNVEYRKKLDKTAITVSDRHHRVTLFKKGNLLTLDKELKLRLAKEEAIQELKSERKKA